MHELKEVSSGTGNNKRGSTLASQGINAATLYVEDEHGVPVDGFRAAAIRIVAHGIFVDLALAGVAPETWSSAGLAASTHYNNEMARRIPEMRFCDSHWKAHLLATNTYPSWHNVHVKKPAAAAAIKEEEPSDTSATSAKSGKRGRQEVANSQSKKRVKDGRGTKGKEKAVSPLAIEAIDSQS